MTLDAAILTSFPQVDQHIVENLLQAEIQTDTKKIVVLDDDPTGVQTVHDISVYTNWSLESMREAFGEDKKLFFILTNSRGFTEEQSIKIHKEIAATVDTAAKESNTEYLFISRSDSTLRGHYPLETEILRAEYESRTGMHIDGEILCPFFKEGGRFTIEDIHYVKYGQTLIAAAETEFAKDKTFGYHSSDLKEYIEEKTKGAFPSSSVISISLDELRSLDFDKIENKLKAVNHFGKIIVNAVDEIDIKIFCVALYRAMKSGKHFMFRTAASIVKIMGGVTNQSLLKRSQMITEENNNGGIIIVGSHTEKTTRQLEMLHKHSMVEFLELDVSLVKNPVQFSQEIKRCISVEKECISSGKTICIYTSRSLITADTGNKEDELKLSVQISDAVQSLIGALDIAPSFIIAKGGITSSDVGTKALAVQRANVLGQIQPGIPVWQTSLGSRFPNIPYVIFPGNVGEDSSLLDSVTILIGE